ncbi:MAG: GNAT family N-acetyltransferase [Actinomycetes bacterium]
MESVRTATAADIETLSGFAAQLALELTPMRGGALWAAQESRREPLDKAFADLLGSQSACVLIGLLDGAPMGFGVAVLERLSDGSLLGDITEIWVEPEARAIGLGESILGSLSDFCIEHGCIGIDARALPGHRQTKNFFEEQGFTARMLKMHKSLD